MKKNSFFYGLLWATIVPLAIFGFVLLLNYIFKTTGIESRNGNPVVLNELRLSIIAIAFNAILLHRFSKRRLDHAIRGIVLPTFIFIMIWLFHYGFIKI